MNKIWIIIKREYLTRVRKKSFVITTILVPFLFLGMILLPVLMMQSDDNEKVAVVDDSKFFTGKMADDGGVHYKFVNAKIDTLKNNYADFGYTGVLHIPAMDINRPGNFNYYSKGQMNVMMKSNMERKLKNVIEDLRMEEAGIDKAKLENIRTQVDIVNLTGKDEKKGSAGLALAVGYGSGFLIYMILLIFGMGVMRGVMEEKTNRVAEVMISSVKPFQLMMGKIVGIAGVGLTQFLIWIVLIVGLNLLLPLFIDPASLQSASAQGGAMGGGQSSAAMVEMMEKINFVKDNVSWSMVIFCFLFYFLGGYLFYAALFAAVGSLVNEDPNDAQSLVFPVTLPVIISIFMMFAAVRKPNGLIAIWGSMIPFTSPVVMMARIPYGVPGTVPYWQLILSMLLLIGGIVGTTWVAAKIYRTGILLYGKKITLKEVGKWLVRKN
ncbi:ABC transporter permease subunit [Chitinophaga sp. SYP-B3965]|uniref:ABC transporter permease n=1 Tax=Chitinophaga sp. SYP-B3965 TaxID=2663120 RepID=UPI0012998AAE|nr:ABC transporter permease [Chitinophaga sp. SYP-B3965]MRG48836.1 ABC transporter permease subunit [Chitinophaga sp. SYP-B3965]